MYVREFNPYLYLQTIYICINVCISKHFIFVSFNQYLHQYLYVQKCHLINDCIYVCTKDND